MATVCSHLLGKHCGSLPSWLCQSINSQGTDKIRTRTDRYLNKAAYLLKDDGGCRRYVRMYAALICLPLALVDRIFCCSWRLSSQWFGFCTSLDKQSAQSQGLAHEWVTVEDGYNRYWQKAGNRSLANQHFIAVRYSVIKKVGWLQQNDFVWEEQKGWAVLNHCANNKIIGEICNGLLSLTLFNLPRASPSW